MGRPARQAPLEHAIADPVRAGRIGRRIVVTGAGGQVGRALVEALADEDVLALHHDDWDVRFPYPEALPRPDLVLHAAAWTDVDGAEYHPDAAFEVNEEGTRNVVALGVPVVYFSTDYVFDGEQRAPYVESDDPRPLSAYGRSKLAGERCVTAGWVIRSSWIFAEHGHNFVRTLLRVARERDELTVVDDQRGSPTYARHLAVATRELVERDLPHGIWHVAAGGDCTWADFADEIVARANLDCVIRRISTKELGRLAARPAYSVLGSERAETPRLPHWRDGLRECLDRSAL